MYNNFLSNQTDSTFLNEFKRLMRNCDEFYFSVSFIKKAGLVLIENDIYEALKRGARGKIITSTYQNFTDIASIELFLEWMNEFSNFSCHLEMGNFGDGGFHSKGYLFKEENDKHLIIGSSNITRFALLKNIEWNVHINSDNTFHSFDKALEEFEYIWKSTQLLSSDLIRNYKIQIDYAIEKWDMDYIDPDKDIIKPNAMQRKALKEIRRYRDMGINKALVISATGSGKTLLSAFDVRNFEAKRLLFICHRDKILSDAKESFMKVFGNSRTYGLYVGAYKEIDADFIFTSNIMLSQNLDMFDPNEFDYICIDEAHHSSSSTYQKIINYFKPNFLLGITATPDRMDNQSIYELFDKNVPYELRLRDAIINDLIVPFHYYGIRDKLVDFKSSDQSKISREIAKKDNVEFIISELNKHRPEGKLKCIAFCTNISHAMLMSEEFNEFGINAVALTGKNDLGERIKAFTNLQDDNHTLEIICAVDILNEGIDIPAINTVLFLRPTESSTIFIQQLGRGLRKYNNKKYVTILDFIGNNYDRSVQIALALGSLGHSTIIEKPYLIDLINNDFEPLDIPGVEIHIDKLSKEELIENIRKQDFNKVKYLQKDFDNFKSYLKKDTYPSHMDFLNSDIAPDLMRLMKSSSINNKKNRSYYNFLRGINIDSIPIFNDDAIKLIDEVSDLLPLIRVDEYIIINQLLTTGKLDIEKLINYNTRVTKETLENALFHLQKSEILKNDSLNSIMNNELYTYLNDLILYGLTRYEIEFGEFSTLFKPYRNYYKEQVMRALCEEGLMFMKGTKFNDNGEVILFVGLKKDKEKIERMNYKDKFISSKVFQWESENNTTWDNAIGKKLMNAKTIHLFVRKMDKEDGITLPFTYFGTGKLTNARESNVDSKQNDGSIKNVPTLLFDVLLDSEVPNEYHFDFEIKEDTE